MIAAANEYLVSCPNTPVVFIGYSLGGIVIMNTLCGGISYSPNVIAAIVRTIFFNLRGRLVERFPHVGCNLAVPMMRADLMLTVNTSADLL